MYPHFEFSIRLPRSVVSLNAKLIGLPPTKWQILCKNLRYRVEHHIIEQQTNSNIIFLTSNEFEHPIFDLEQSNFEPNRAFTRFTKLLIKLSNSNIIFTNIERTRTSSSIGNRTRTPYFCLRTIELQTSNIVRLITICFNHHY